jgi:serpin B
MKKLLTSTLIVFLALCLVACGSVSQNTLYGQLLKSNLSHDLSPNVSQSDVAALVAGNSAFALDLYQALKTGEPGNFLYSPYCLSLALAMAYAGARGETEKQMADVLHFTLGQAKTHQGFNYLGLELARRPKATAADDFKLNIANAAWGQNEDKFLKTYLDTLAVNYGAGLRTADFNRAPEEARQSINRWVSDETAGKIPELISDVNDIDGATLVLTNAIYFNAKWAYPFNPANTDGGAFTLLDGTAVTVPMMQQTMAFNYLENPDYQAIELPYKDQESSMVVLLPREGRYSEFENSLNAEKVAEIIAALERKTVRVSMPKFSYSSGYKLNQTLIDMGMPAAFGGADFSGISGGSDLFISNVGHKTIISVDERGTEAAAAAYVAILGIPNIEFTMDRPFIFLIRDNPTGTILFAGRVMNPAK